MNNLWNRYPGSTFSLHFCLKPTFPSASIFYYNLDELPNQPR
jgi:hypothetical protein